MQYVKFGNKKKERWEVFRFHFNDEKQLTTGPKN